MFGLSRTKTVRQLEAESDAVARGYEEAIAALQGRLTAKEQDMAALDAILQQERTASARRASDAQSRHEAAANRAEVEIARLSGENLALRERAVVLETQWKLVTMHEWHVSGKKDVHAAGVLLQYECPHCEARLYAEEGGL